MKLFIVIVSHPRNLNSFPLFSHNCHDIKQPQLLRSATWKEHIPQNKEFTSTSHENLKYDTTSAQEKYIHWSMKETLIQSFHCRNHETLSQQNRKLNNRKHFTEIYKSKRREKTSPLEPNTVVFLFLLSLPWGFPSCWQNITFQNTQHSIIIINI